MTQEHKEIILFAVTIATFVISVAVGLWKILEGKLKAENALMRSELEKSDLRYELAFNGLRERFEHFSVRTRNEISETRSEIGEIKSWLIKHTTFEERS